MRRTLFALLLAISPSVALAVPAQLNTQGRVLDTDGQPVDDTLAVSFRLLDSESGGSTLWEETQEVTFTSGFYSVMLGADESGNPLEDDVLDQWPLYLEVQIEGEGPMFPRMEVGSVPYARQADVTAELAPGADIDAGSLTVDGTEVVASDGSWTGPTPLVDWADLTGVPGDFSDGDDADTLADLVCSDGQWAVFDASSATWSCDGFSDTVLSDVDVVVAVGTDAVDLYPGSMMDGYTLLTEDSAIDWGLLVGVPSDLDDGDDDTLAGLSCSDGQVAVYDTTAAFWACGDDTDTTLSVSEVVAAVEAAGSLALPSGTTVGGSGVVTSASTVDWSQLSAVPSGLADGDDDTLGVLSCSGSAIPVYSGTAWTCGSDTDTTLTASEVVAAVDTASAVVMTGSLSVGGYAVLTESSDIPWAALTDVPSGLADGDDDTLAGLSCAGGDVAEWDATAGAWACATDDGISETEVESHLASTAVDLAAGSTVGGEAIASVPAGAIVMWSGSVDSIPSDWALCDGDSGTPDLTDQFVMGAGDTYSPGDSGGSSTLSTGTDSVMLFYGSCSSSAGCTTALTTGGGSYLPPYYALAFIMKL